MKEQREKVVKTLQNKLFVTPETREAIHRAASERSRKRVAEIEQDLEEILDQMLKMTTTQRVSAGENIIILTPERGIGKTTALIKIAAEWNIPIIAAPQEKHFMSEEIRHEYSHEEIQLLTTREAERAIRGTQYRVVLKTELEPIEKVREMLQKIGMEQITVIGFEGV